MIRKAKRRLDFFLVTTFRHFGEGVPVEVEAFASYNHRKPCPALSSDDDGFDFRPEQQKSKDYE